MSSEVMLVALVSFLATCLISVLSFFGVKLVNGMEGLRSEMGKLRLDMVERFATKEEVDARMEDVDEMMDTKFEMCELRHHQTKLKEVV